VRAPTLEEWLIRQLKRASEALHHAERARAVAEADAHRHFDELTAMRLWTEHRAWLIAKAREVARCI